MSWPKGAPERVTIAEGLPDFLTWAQRGERVIGVWAGSDGDPRLGAIVPDGWTVTIRTDPDGAGEAYAKRWAAILPRGCKVLRPASEAERKVHDAVEAVRQAATVGELELVEALCARDGSAVDARVYAAARKRRLDLQPRGV